MNRRQLFGALAAACLLPAVAIADSRTPAERKAGIKKVDSRFPPGDIRRYGAVGDGVHDDTDALQAALNAGPGVVIPPGCYAISRVLEIGHSDTVIVGSQFNLRGRGAGIRMSAPVQRCVISGNVVIGDSTGIYWDRS